MKKLLATVCIAGSAIALSACDTTGRGNVDTGAPYEMERTASHSTGDVEVRSERDSERTFRKMQTK